MLLELEELVEEVLEPPNSASNGAGGGVVNIVHPIHPVMPRIPTTAMLTTTSITTWAKDGTVRENRYPIKTKTDTTRISPPYDWSLFTLRVYLAFFGFLSLYINQ